MTSEVRFLVLWQWKDHPTNDPYPYIVGRDSRAEIDEWIETGDFSPEIKDGRAIVLGVYELAEEQPS